MNKTKSCKRKEKFALALLFAEIAFMAFLGINGIYGSTEKVPSVTVLIRSIDHIDITGEMMNEYVQDMNDSLVIKITEKTGSATPQDFLRTYVKQEPEYEQILEEKYHITTQKKDFYKAY